MELHELMALGKDCRGKDITWELVEKYSFHDADILLFVTTCPYATVGGGVLKDIIAENKTNHSKNTVHEDFVLKLNDYCVQNNFNLAEQEKIYEATAFIRGKDVMKRLPALIDVADDFYIREMENREDEKISPYADIERSPITILKEDGYIAYDFDKKAPEAIDFTSSSFSKNYQVYGMIFLIEKE